YFFFQAEDGIRDFHVTGVQTCALPIFKGAINLPLSKIKRNKVEIPTDKDIILYCQTGIRSKQAAKVLRRRHKDMPIAHLKGGLFSLKTPPTPKKKHT